MLAGKCCVITGGASGIGEAAARLFVREGAQVVLGDVQQERARQLAEDLGAGKALAVVCDVAREEDVEHLAAAALDAFGRLDVWCSNAGVYNRAGLTSMDALIENMSMADFDRQVQVNLRGVALGTKHAAAAMRASGAGSSAGGGGCIINTASVAGLAVNCSTHGDPVFVGAGYSASKHGVVALTKLAACELAPYRIRVNAVAPGYTATPMLARTVGLEGIPKEELEAKLAKTSVMPGVPLRAEDVAAAMLFLASDMGRCVNGHVLVVDNGLLAGVAGYVPGLEVTGVAGPGEGGQA